MTSDRRRGASPGILVACMFLGFLVLGIGAGNKERYYLDVVKGEAADGVPAPLVTKAQAAVVAERTKRPELVADLKGAPDAKADPKAFKRYLDNHKLKAYAVTVKVTAARTTLKDHPQGKEGKVLEAHVEVQLMGDNIPEGTMGLAGQGSGTVMLEVGSKARPRDAEVATEEALASAVGRALDDAVNKLRTAKPPK